MALYRFVTAFLLAAIAAPPLAAGVESVGTTSATFTKLGSGARPAALGEAYVALADSADGLAYNPAGTSQMLSGEVLATHSEWFQGIRYENLCGVFSLGDGGMIGLNFASLLVPQLTRTEQVADTGDPSLNYRETGSFTPYDMQFGVSYARPVYPNLLGGVTLKMLAQNIDQLTSFGIGFDLGVIYKTPLEGLSAGLAFQNLGTPIKFRKEGFALPMIARLGADWETFKGKLKVLPEIDLPADNYPVFAIGMEYELAKVFYPRVGYRYNNIFNPWSVGLGVRWELWGFDFSVVPYGELGMTYRGTLGFRFGSPGASLHSPHPYLSSVKSGQGMVIRQDVSAPDKVAAWGLYVYSSGAKPAIVRSWTGRGPTQGEQIWDGVTNAGQPAPEGVYNAILSLRYVTGQVVYSDYLRIEVNNQAPKADLELAADSRDPQDPGNCFIPVSFKPSFAAGRTVESWKLEVYGPDDKLFRTLEGTETLPETITWDGKGPMGEAFISGQIYRFRLVIIDKVGNASQPLNPLGYKAVFRR